MKKGIFITVKGIVTDVGFREALRLFAKANGAYGYAQNTRNKNVLIHAEGETNQLKKLVKFIESNPGESSVKSVNIIPAEALKNYKIFRRVTSIFQD